MQLKQAIDRLAFTISKSNKPNKTDAEAFDTLMEFFQKTQEETVRENLLFAKIYTAFLREKTNEYLSVDIAQDFINRTLQKSFEWHIQYLKSAIQTAEIADLFIENKVSRFEIERDYKSIRKQYETLKPIFKNFTDEKLKQIQQTTDDDFVRKNLEFQINQSIQNFKNNV